MIIVNVGGESYKIYFKHGVCEKKINTRGLFGQLYTEVRSTECSVVDGNDVELAYGRATTAPEDNFCRETGRKIALTRALGSRTAQMHINKAHRTEIWKKYFAVTKKTNLNNKIQKLEMQLVSLKKQAKSL